MFNKFNGGNPYGSLRAAGVAPSTSFKRVECAARNSDLPPMKANEYIGFIADELLYQSGLVDTDIEDYLNEMNISHGTQGRRHLADMMTIYNAAPLHKEPSIEDLYRQLGARYGCSAESVRGRITRFLAGPITEFLREQKYQLVILPHQKKPRGYMGQIHNVMLSVGLSEMDEGFDYLRFAVWTVIRSGARDRRAFMNRILPVVAKKYGKAEWCITSAVNTAIYHAALGGTFSEVLFRLVNILEPQDDAKYQLADEILHAHGFGTRQRLKGYECLRVAMVKLAENPAWFGMRYANVCWATNEELGYGANLGNSILAQNLIHYFLHSYKEAQQIGSDWGMLQKLACELITLAEERQVA